MGTTDGTRMLRLIDGSKRRTRRDFLLGSAKLAAGGTLAAAFAGRRLPAFAQGTPGAVSLNYPELKVSITDQGYDLSATSVPEGLLLLTVTNKRAIGLSSVRGISRPPRSPPRRHPRRKSNRRRHLR